MNPTLLGWLKNIWSWITHGLIVFSAALWGDFFGLADGAMWLGGGAAVGYLVREIIENLDRILDHTMDTESWIDAIMDGVGAPGIAILTVMIFL